VSFYSHNQQLFAAQICTIFIPTWSLLDYKNCQPVNADFLFVYTDAKFYLGRGRL